MILDEIDRENFKNLVRELLLDDIVWPDKKKIINLFDIEYFNMEKEISCIMKRKIMCKQFSFAIPSKEALDLITSYQPILEIGAGSGFWAYLLQKNNCDIIPTTIDSEEHPFKEKFTEIEYLTAIEALLKYPDRTIFCCWPYYYLDELLPYIKRDLIYIGEWGGATISEETVDIFKEQFDIVEILEMARWNFPRDSLYVLRRKI